MAVNHTIIFILDTYIYWLQENKKLDEEDLRNIIMSISIVLITHSNNVVLCILVKKIMLRLKLKEETYY